MKNNNIARVLKYYRKLNNFSVKDVSNMLNGVNLSYAEKTIYAWETGRTQPDADTLLYLCRFYDIDNILDTFGYTENSSIPLIPTDFEKNLILAYRSRPELHSAIDKLLDL